MYNLTDNMTFCMVEFLTLISRSLRLCDALKYFMDAAVTNVMTIYPLLVGLL